MKKLNYITFLFLLLIVSSAKAQNVKPQSKIQESAIEGLSLYPNPITNGRVYIATKNDAEKEIQIFDVLGKKIVQTQLNTRELNISSLSPGVYIIKIREEESTATRKLIIR
jgi:adenylate kinase family enzyme